jgi:serine/threonine protein kinase
VNKPERQHGRFAQVQGLFESALDRPAADRARFLDSACGGDAELRREVESLIHHFEAGEDFLSTPAVLEALARIDEGTSAQTGLRFGRFEVIAKLGAGGMGEVYLARDTELRREVAIKLLPVAITQNPEALARFRREARALSALNHPNVLTVYEVGEAGGRPFLVMEYIEGPTLRERLKERRLTSREAVDIAKQLASGLIQTHDAGIVHRDIKPENILIRKDEIVKLVDFGLAKLNETAPDDQTLKTMPGARMGTVQYMSPEQLHGDSEVGGASDVWSLGVVLFEMLTGDRPFEGETPNHVAVQILERAAGRVKFESRAATEMGKTLFTAALAKDQAQRPSAREFLRQLDTLDETLRADPAETVSPRAVPIRGRPVGKIAAACAVALAITAGLWWAIRPPKVAYDFENSRMVKLTSTGRVLNAAISDDGDRFAYSEADAGLFSLYAKDMRSMDAVPLLKPVPFRYWGITFAPRTQEIYFVREDDPRTKTLYRMSTSDPGISAPIKVLDDVDSAITFAPDGKHFAFIRNTTARRENSLIVADAGGSGLVTLATRKDPEGFNESGPAWSPDGSTIIAPVLQRTSAGTIATGLIEYRPDGGAARRLSTSWRYAGRPVWTGPGAVVIPALDTDALTSRLVWLSVPSGETRTVLADLNGYDSLSAARASRGVAGVQSESVWSIWTGSAGMKDLRRVTEDRSQYKFVAWAPSGRLVVQTSETGDSNLFEMAADGSGRRRLTTDNSIAWRPAVGADGSIFFQSNRSGSWNLWTISPNGGNPRALTEGPQIDSSPQPTRDGKWVIYVSRASGKTTLWRMPANGGRATQLTDVRSDHPALSPDGRWIACDYMDDAAAAAGQIAILHVDGGEPVHRVKAIPEGALYRWSPDGKTITYVQTVDRVSNLWSVSVSGGSPKRLTDFTAEQIASFDWSKDGRNVALVRGTNTRDVILIRPAAPR